MEVIYVTRVKSSNTIWHVYNNAPYFKNSPQSPVFCYCIRYHVHVITHASSFGLGNTTKAHVDKTATKTNKKNPQQNPAISCLQGTQSKEKKSGHRKSGNNKMTKNVLGKY